MVSTLVTTLIIVSVMLIICLIIDEMACRSTYGGFVDDSILEDFEINEEKIRFNTFNNSILNTEPTIAKHTSMTSRFYIQGIGRVLLFSKTDKEISRLFEICEKQNKKKIRIS
jgi:hypothetical protein